MMRALAGSRSRALRHIRKAFARPALAVLLAGLSSPAWSQSCSGNDLIDVTFAAGSRWDMCWELKAEEGVVLSDLHFTPNGTEPRRQVMHQANLAEIYVAFDDGAPSAFHVTDIAGGGGLGVSGNIHVLTASDCPGGSLRTAGGDAVLCEQILPRGYAYKWYGTVKQGQALVVQHRATVGLNTYVVRWRLFDDGTIEPSVGLSGEIPALTSQDKHGWVLDAAGRIGTAFNTSYYWRLDFDIGTDASDDIVEEIEIQPSVDRTKKTISQTSLTSETSRSVDADVKRSWRVRDGTITNSDGRSISYHVEPLHTAHRFAGTIDSPWAMHDLHVTAFNSCERFVRANPTTGGCGNDITDFVNGQAIYPADIVLWYRINYHHLPRSEDEPSLPIHWDGFSIVPRDWTSTNPITRLTIGAPDFDAEGHDTRLANG